MRKGLFRNSPRYRKFVRDRDQALEQLLNNAQIKNSNVLRGTFRHILTIAKLNYTQLTGPNYNQALQTISAEVNSALAHARAELLNNLLTLRRVTYYLSRSSEVEAIAQATDKPLRNEIPHFDQQARINKHSAAGGQLSDRISLYLNRIGSKIINNAHAAAISRIKDSDGIETPLSQDDFLLRTYYAFPKTKRVKRLKRELKSYLYEADSKAKVDISQDFLDDRSWREVVDEYLKEIPSTRGPEEIAGKRLTPEGDEETYYQWELERDTTQEFVQSVREGQMDGAEAQGIKDFVWIAIIDDVTDECCRWRDGLTLTEIEEKLKGERSDDSCQATTPPAHFFCRCSIEPVTEVPDAPASNAKDFDEWLNS